MILPIAAFGDPVLKTKAIPVEKNSEGLETLLADMWETMYNAGGVGLAAPQIGKSIRIFVIDASPFAEDEAALKDFKKVFINAVITKQWGEEWVFNEGCLSFPDLREDIYRKPNLRISYLDEHFNHHEEEFGGMAARIIQHEYDHIEGIVMTDRINPLKRTLIRNRLMRISKGEVDAGYPMKYPLKKR
ncbi:MAG TPA: peptide deformylase [Bacteroidales bacterium]|nr:peptide deformylase [Bacteroidales bacterium]